MDLLPPQFRSQAARRRRQPWLLASAALTVAALVPPIVHFQALIAVTQQKAANLERDLVDWRARDARNRTTLKRLADVRRQIVGWQSLDDRRTTWTRLFADLQEGLTKVGDAWLDRVQLVAAPASGRQPAGPIPPWRIAVSGRMLDKANPRSTVSDETFQRFKSLLASFTASPVVAAVENEAFDRSQPGVLRFDFVLVVEASHPL